MEQYDEYAFLIVVHDNIYTYFIMEPDSETLIKIKAVDRFETEQEARYAAIGHISLLQQGEVHV